MTNEIVYTPNLKLSKLPENFHVWAVYMNSNLAMIDAAISRFVSFPGMRGPWSNSTVYALGDIALDVDESTMWQTLVPHTSATAPTTFAQDRAAHPTFWTNYLPPAHARGVWVGPGTSYVPDDFVIHGTQYAMCIAPHVSSNDFDFDVSRGFWTVLLDIGNQSLPLLTGAPDANKIVISNSLGTVYTSTAYTVDTTTNLDTLLDRPPRITTKGALAIGDGGGGEWYWKTGDTTPVNFGTCRSPGGSPTGRYLRNFSGPVQAVWFGLSLVDSTAAIQAALNLGNCIVQFPANSGPWPVNNISQTVAGVDVDLNGATIIDKAGGVTWIWRIAAANCRIRNGTIQVVNSAIATSLTQALYIQNDGTRVEDMSVIGQKGNPRTPNVMAAPANCINVLSTTSSVLNNVTIRRTKVRGGVRGINVNGARDLTISDIECNDNMGHSCALGAGYPIIRCSASRIRSIGSGGYGFLTGNLASDPTDPFPVQDLIADDIQVQRCGFYSMLNAYDGAVGSGKGGVDFTTTDMTRSAIRGQASNCCNYGLECKHSIENGAGYTVYPPHFKSNVVNWTTHMDADNGVGVYFVSGQSTNTAATYAHWMANCNVFYNGTIAWVTGQRVELWECRNANGWEWYCLGDGSGNPGTTGATAPGTAATIGNVRVNATGGTNLAGQPNVTVVSGAGIATGNVWKAYGSTYWPDGTTVSNVVGNVVTLSNNITTNIPSGTSLMFALEFSDGAMWWLAGQPAPATRSINTTGIVIYQLNNLTLTGKVTACEYGVSLQGNGTTDNATNNVTLSGMDIKNCTNGVRIVSTNFTPINITNITKANPCVITTASAHGLSVNSSFGIRNVVGMVEINGMWPTIASVTSTTITTTLDTSGGGFTAYASGGQVFQGTVFGNININNCYIDGDAGTGSNALTIGGGANSFMSPSSLITVNGGRLRTVTGSSAAIQLITTGAPINLTLTGGVYISAPSTCFFGSVNTSFNVNADNVMFETLGGGGVPIDVTAGPHYATGAATGGSTFKFGRGSQIRSANLTQAGWSPVSGVVSACTVLGEVLRLDRGAAAPTGFTKGNIGEFMYLNTPTATERGYLCTSADAPAFTTMVWKKLPLA